MNGLDRTYQFLATTPNRAALALLAPALQCQQAAVRRRALTALLHRDPLEGGREILRRWHRLGEDERVLLMDRGRWFQPAVQESLQAGAGQPLTAIDMARSLSLYEVTPLLIDKAESDGSHVVRREALAAVLQMASLLGHAARGDRDRPSVRGPVLERLCESVQRYSIHRCDGLVDAYLAASSWSDSRLKGMLAETTPAAHLLLRRLRDSSVTTVVQLLAGYLRRRQIPAVVEPLIRSREDLRFRHALLAVVGNELTVTLRRNLASLGVPACCQAGPTVLGSLAPRARVSLALVYAAAEANPVQVMSIIVSVLEQVSGDEHLGLVQTLARLRFPDSEMLLRAAVLLAGNDPAEWADDPQAMLLNRMLGLLNSPDAAVARAVRAVLQPLHVEAVLGRLEQLRPKTRQRLGAMVMRVDVNAIERVREQLRHPVMARRLEAVVAAAALGIADRLNQPLTQMAVSDHQEARVRAVDALGTGASAMTWETLQELAGDLNGPVRDAAIQALATRGTA